VQAAEQAALDAQQAERAREREEARMADLADEEALHEANRTAREAAIARAFAARTCELFLRICIPLRCAALVSLPIHASTS